MRRTAHVVEQMAPGGIERPDPGRVDRDDLGRAHRRLVQDLSRTHAAPRRDAARRAVRCVERLRDAVEQHGGPGAVYLDPAESLLPPRYRSAAIEIDFSFGDRDGRVSEDDLVKARRRYAAVRGPVGWNRMLVADEVERRLYPSRVLASSAGGRLLPSDWQAAGRDPLIRLRALCPRLDDATLARTYADVAARFATCSEDDARRLYEAALTALARQIRGRRSVRPTLSDIARIGCEDAGVRAVLHSPMEMARCLKPELLERLRPGGTDVDIFP